MLHRRSSQAGIEFWWFPAEFLLRLYLIRNWANLSKLRSPRVHWERKTVDLTKIQTCLDMSGRTDLLVDWTNFWLMRLKKFSLESLVFRLTDCQHGLGGVRERYLTHFISVLLIYILNICTVLVQRFMSHLNTRRAKDNSFSKFLGNGQSGDALGFARVNVCSKFSMHF